MKQVAVLKNETVIAINNMNDDYQLATDEVEVTNAAFVGGDHVDGWFYAPQPYPSWTRHRGNWKPPVPYPTGDGMWSWDEGTQTWVQVDG